MVREWIDAGAPWDESWSTPAKPTGQAALWVLRPLVRPEPPTVQPASWLANPIDAFILARLRSAGLSPAPMADRLTLIRRATFDLLGLPPTPAEIDAFLADPSPTAYERLIDRLLASPHYGERWGRHWLDVARFSESHGFEYDHIRDNAWPYRDYVIQSLNADRPYTQFVREQIAGDVLEPVTRDGIVATGFLVAGTWDEANQIQKSAVMRQRVREEELEDMVAAVGQVFLGLDRQLRPMPRPQVRPGASARLLPDQGRDRRGPARQPADARPAPTRMPRESRSPTRPGRVPRRRHFMLGRGDVEKQGERVAAGGLSAVKSPSADFGLAADAPEGVRRSKLAEWVADPSNPMTARVIVNRVWHYHFGTGLVATPNDFGRNGDRPSHPELLDWLASDFLAQGSRLKALHRRIMLSSTYRQSSRFDAKAAAVDADDRLLWRFPARRLEAEAIRDAMLHASGRAQPPDGRPELSAFQADRLQLELLRAERPGRARVQSPDRLSDQHQLGEGPAPRNTRLSRPVREDAEACRDHDTPPGPRPDERFVRPPPGAMPGGPCPGGCRLRRREADRLRLSPHDRTPATRPGTRPGLGPGARGRAGRTGVGPLQFERVLVSSIER